RRDSDRPGGKNLTRLTLPFTRRDRQNFSIIASVALNSGLRPFQKVCRSGMTIVPIRYVEPVYRPPSEADSLILPVTDGCSWNRCTFCEMYTDPQKRFRPRSEEEVLESIRRCREQFGDGVRRVFLADGDAMTLSTRRLVTVLEAIRRDLPGVRRGSGYCLPRNLRKKSAAGLRGVAGLCLSLRYVGAEYGGDAGAAPGQQGGNLRDYAGGARKVARGGDQTLGDDPQRARWPGAVATARAELGGANERRATRISRHACCELPKGRSAAARKFSQLGAAQC